MRTLTTAETAQHPRMSRTGLRIATIATAIGVSIAGLTVLTGCTTDNSADAVTDSGTAKVELVAKSTATTLGREIQTTAAFVGASDLTDVARQVTSAWASSGPGRSATVTGGNTVTITVIEDIRRWRCATTFAVTATEVETDSTDCQPLP